MDVFPASGDPEQLAAPGALVAGAVGGMGLIIGAFRRLRGELKGAYVPQCRTRLKAVSLTAHSLIGLESVLSLRLNKIEVAAFPEKSVGPRLLVDTKETGTKDY